MDRQVSKSRLRKEKTMMIIKIGGSVIGFAVFIVLISLILRPSVSLKEAILSEATTGNLDITVSASGKVVPAFEETINSPISSRIVEVYLKSGDAVDKGTPILKLDLQSVQTDYNKLLDEEQTKLLQLEQLRLTDKNTLSGMEMNLKVKQMELEQKEVELRNERFLDSLGAGTPDKVRQAEMAYKVAQLQLQEDRQKYENEKSLSAVNEKVKELELNIFRKGLAEKRRTLEDAQIRAPRAAVLSYVNTEIGAQVSQGTRVAVISDVKHFKIDGEVADSYAQRIDIGRSAIVKIGKDLYDGVVSNLAPTSNGGVISFSVQLSEDSDDRLRSGLNCEVYIVDSCKENALRIANGSYYIGRGTYQLFVLEDGTTDKGGILRRREVRLGDCNFDYVEVLDGLHPGDIVLTSTLKGSRASKDRLRLTR